MGCGLLLLVGLQVLVVVAAVVLVITSGSSGWQAHPHRQPAATVTAGAVCWSILSLTAATAAALSFGWRGAA
jgi:hypothetical protein